MLGLRVAVCGDMKGERFGTVNDCVGCWLLCRIGGVEMGWFCAAERKAGVWRCSGVGLALPNTFGPGGTGGWYEDGAAPVNEPLVMGREAVSGRTGQAEGFDG